MRLTPAKVVSTFLTITTFVIFWNVLDTGDSTSKDVTICQQPESIIKQVHDLTDRVHHVLSTLGVSHWLCYGSLWGQIRLGRTLSWERRAQLCARNEELSPVDELFLQRAFTKHGLAASYSSSEGAYEVQAGTTANIPNAPIVQLIVFEFDDRSGMLRRVGWKRRLLPPDCASLPTLQCFPPRLVSPPLPSREFGGYILPVPREGIELQKYHYQDNWWKEIKPNNC